MALLLHIIQLQLINLSKRFRFRWRLIRAAFTLQPIAGADGEGDGEGDGDGEPAGSSDGDGDGDGDGEPASSSDGDGDGDGDGEPASSRSREPNWKQQSRKHEREAKKARAEAEKLRQQLVAREDQDKSETEKRIEEAEQRARDETTSKYETERQHDRLENVTFKLAAKGVTVGSGKDAKTVKFADPDDAIVYLERAISNGDVDQDEIFDDKGKVRSDNLEEALAEVLEAKPHLVAGDKPGPKVKGSGDGGKGSAATTDGGVEDQLSQIRRHRSSKSDEGARYRKAG
jgi:hypothetical protein